LPWVHVGVHTYGFIALWANAPLAPHSMSSMPPWMLTHLSSLCGAGGGNKARSPSCTCDEGAYAKQAHGTYDICKYVSLALQWCSPHGGEKALLGHAVAEQHMLWHTAVFNTQLRTCACHIASAFFFDTSQSGCEFLEVCTSSSLHEALDGARSSALCFPDGPSLLGQPFDSPFKAIQLPCGRPAPQGLLPKQAPPTME